MSKDRQSSTPSNLFDRSPPHSPEAEKGVLGSLLLDPRVCDDVALLLRPEEFYSPAYRKVYECMLALHNSGKKIDTTLLIERLKAQGDFEMIGGMAMLLDIAEQVPTAANAVWYATTVRDRATKRKVLKALSEGIRDAYDDLLSGDEVLARAIGHISAASDATTQTGAMTLSDALTETMADIDRRATAVVPSGYSTPWHDGRMLGLALRPGELVVISGRPGSGKTSLALNIVDYVTSIYEVGALIISLEMNRVELCHRLLSSRGEVHGENIREGRLTFNERTRLIETSVVLHGANVAIDDTPSQSLVSIAAQARRLKRRGNLGVVLIDYLTLIEPDNLRDTEYERVSKYSRRLKVLAKELNIPVLVLAQMNREFEKSGTKGGRPKLSHLRGGGSIEQDADVVAFVHRPEMFDDEPDLKGKAELIVEKNRNGKTGIVPLVWFDGTTKFASAVRSEC